MSLGRWMFALVLMLTFVGCGDEDTPSSEPLVLGDEQVAMTPGQPDGTCTGLSTSRSTSGQFYVDTDISERSAYTGGMSDSEPPIKPKLTIVGAESGTYEVSTCEDGTYEIGGLSDGTYLIAPDLGNRQCSTNNCSSTFATALKETGSAVVVTFGDSLAVYGERPFFPDRFNTLVSSLGNVTNRNVAVPGSTSSDWLPGSYYFRTRLGPHIESADLIVITIGGNDLADLVNNAFQFVANPASAVVAAQDAVEQAIVNLKEIIAAIRLVNPTVDVAFCLYPDYTQANGTIWTTVNNFLGQGELGTIIAEARQSFPSEDPNLILVDVFGAAQDISLRDHLYTLPNGQIDPLHFSAKGHILYAEELFRSVGGILIGSTSPLGELGQSPIGAERNFGFVP